VIVGHNSELGENSVVSKSCVGRKVRLGKNASVTNSILFDGVVLGDNAKVIGCLIGAGVTIKAGSVIHEQCILGDGVVIEEGKVVPEGTRLVREAEDDEFGGGDQDTGGDKGELGYYIFLGPCGLSSNRLKLSVVAA
jgi:translation initiation factor eIF-2B subunit epsilon